MRRDEWRHRFENALAASEDNASCGWVALFLEAVAAAGWGHWMRLSPDCEEKGCRACKLPACTHHCHTVTVTQRFTYEVAE